MSPAGPGVGTPLATSLDEVVGRVGERAAQLLELSHDLHRHPELGFREHRSARAVARLASYHGLPVTVGVGGLPTAFCGQVGSGPVVVVLCEYDALPTLGHACGHNIVSAAGLGAALALLEWARLGTGTVRLLGCPAEEGMGGGKERLARAGLFDGAVAALMVHPGTADVAQPTTSACLGLAITVHGRAAHASMAPEKGIDALDGLVQGYTALHALRPHLLPGGQVSAVFTEGGTAPNVVPARAVAELLLRSPTAAGLGPLRERVLRAFHGGAAAVGATITTRSTGLPYSEVRRNPPLARAYVTHARTLGRPAQETSDVVAGRAGSTDVGNASRRLPCLQPHIAIAPAGTASHSPAFARAAVSSAGDRAVLDGAAALAATALDLWTQPELRAAVYRRHQEAR